MILVDDVQQVSSQTIHKRPVLTRPKPRETRSSSEFVLDYSIDFQSGKYRFEVSSARGEKTRVSVVNTQTRSQSFSGPMFSRRVHATLIVSGGLLLVGIFTSLVGVIAEAQGISIVGAFLVMAAAIGFWAWIERADAERKTPKAS